jgi:putative membrane-bound dehydrogenase-like protein
MLKKNPTVYRLLLLLGFLASPLVHAAWERTKVPKGFKMPKPITLEESLASFKTKPELRVELVAAEPLVMDPINLDFGPDGKLWVVEMADYPLGIDGKGKPGGRVRYLEDRNGDGRYETSTLFLDGLNFPTGVKAWRKGVLIVAAPEVLYAKDTDGDGKADLRKTLFRGFGEGNQQHRVNGLVWGLDNWLHIANGDSGGNIESLKTGEKLNLGAFDLKIRPDSGEVKLTAGRTQYGRTRDDFGNWFGNNNSFPLWQFVLPNEKLLRNPHVIYPRAVHHVPEDPSAPKIFPASKTTTRYNNPFSASHITSACGISLMRDHRLGSSLYGNAFICEPVHNLIHRQVLSREGITFRGRRSKDETESEFLASTDPWFRPVSSVTGPDGALWVVDMHRYVIEHPEWIPEAWQNVIDLRAGSDRGRIYRVTSKETGLVGHERLDRLSNKELVKKLSSENGWTRDMAHQLLLWRKPQAKDLKNLPKKATTLGKMHFLSLLDGLGGVTKMEIQRALASKAPELQTHALRFVKPVNVDSKLVDQICDLALSPEAAVRFHAALALGEIPSKQAGLGLARSALADSSSYHQAAVMSSLVPHQDMVIETIARADTKIIKPMLDSLFAITIATGNDSGTEKLLTIGKPGDGIRNDAYLSMVAALDRYNLDLASYAKKVSPELRKALEPTKDLIHYARAKVKDSSRNPQNRIAAMALLGGAPAFLEEDVGFLLSLLSHRTSPDVAKALVRRLAKLGRFKEILKHWLEVSPSLRATIIGQCMASEKGSLFFLDQVANGKIAFASVDASSRNQFRSHRNDSVRKKSDEVFSKGINADRQAVIKSFDGILGLKGDLQAGREHFKTLCSACHKLDGIGISFGPDLTALSDKSTPSMLTAILDPNRAVEDKFLLYAVTLNDGTATAGMIQRESGNAITLQIMDGSTEQLLRTQIKGLQNTGRSAMPEGLEAALKPQMLADLITFIQTSTSAEKQP